LRTSATTNTTSSSAISSGLIVSSSRHDSMNSSEYPQWLFDRVANLDSSVASFGVAERVAGKSDMLPYWLSLGNTKENTLNGWKF
jgi:hypothetical protein